MLYDKIKVPGDIYMLKRIKSIGIILLKNFRCLLLFEISYRIIGLLFIFPLVSMLYQLSVNMSGYAYITNTLLVDYLTKPITLLFLFFIMMIIVLYIMIELIYLHVIFNYGEKDEHIQFYEILMIGWQRIRELFTKRFFIILGPSICFILAIEMIQFIGIASSFDVINEWMSTWRQLPLFTSAIYILIGLLIITMVEFIFKVPLAHQFQLEKHDVHQINKTILKKHRIPMYLDFVSLNLIINLGIYLFFGGLIILIGWIASLLQNSAFGLSIALSTFYTLHLILSFLTSMIIVPINYALVITWYKKRYQPQARRAKDKLTSRRLFAKRSLTAAMIMGIVGLITLNFFTVSSMADDEQVALEILNTTSIVAHRGAAMDAPENTLSAFEKAIDLGADVIEFDVRATKEGIPVVMHDKDTQRTTDDIPSHLIHHMSLEALQELDAGSWFSDDFAGEKVPTLEEVLIAIDGRIPLFIELKVESIAFESRILQLVETYSSFDQVTFLSFSVSQLIRMKNIQPEIRTLLLISTFYGNKEALAQTPEVDAFGFSVSYLLDNPKMIEVIHGEGKSVYVWAIKNPKNMETFVDLDIDGMITSDIITARQISSAKNIPEWWIRLLKSLFE